MTSLTNASIRGPREAVFCCPGPMQAIIEGKKIQYSASGDTLASTARGGLYAS